MTLQEAATCGRSDGQRQRNTVVDHMKFKHSFPTERHWLAYVTGFYRGAGYDGSSNRTQRR